jgi:hypothetical protein
MKTAPIKFLGGVLLLVILVIGGIALALSQHNVAKQTVGAVPNDPLVAVNISASLPQGELVYLVNTLPPGPPRPITYDLVTQATGPGSGIKGVKNIYQITADPINQLFTCQFSPNGKFVLLKEGIQGGRMSSFHIFLWDSRTKQLQPGPNAALSYPETYWSPDARFIAYIQGGDADGDEIHGTDPICLYVYDVMMKKSQLVVQNPEAKSLAWTDQGTLLYTFKSRRNDDTPLTYSRRRSDIYEFRVSSGSSMKLIDGAAEPSPSPDGRRVAFVGWPDRVEEAKAAIQAKARGRIHQSMQGLYLYDRLQKERTLFHNFRAEEAHDVLLWSSDSKRLYGVQNVYNSTQPSFTRGSDTKDYPGYGLGHIYSIEIPTLKRREVAVIQAKDDMARPDPESQFQLKSVSRNGIFLYVYAHELIDDDPNSNYLSARRSLYALNLTDGSQTVVLSAKNASGLDWREVP